MLQILEELRQILVIIYLQTITVCWASFIGYSFDYYYYCYTFWFNILSNSSKVWMYLENKSLLICQNQRTAWPAHPAVHTQTLCRHCTREAVSVILWKLPNTGRCVDWLKGEKSRRQEMTGEEGKMSSSIKSPYVYSLSSIVRPGVSVRHARVWTG